MKPIAFVLISLAVAALLIVEGPDWSEKLGRSGDLVVRDQFEVGQVLEVEGTGTRVPFPQGSPMDLETAQTLRHLDKIELQSRAKVQISLKGFKLVLQGPGLFIVESWNSQQPKGPALLQVISGDFYILNEGPSGQLFVLKDGELKDPKSASAPKVRSLLISQLQLGEPVPSTLPAEVGMSTTSSKPSEQDEIPSNDYLDGEIGKQKDQFQKCQSNALREQAEARGQILVGLTIAPDGKVTEVRVVNSTMLDNKMNSCILEVFRRLKFNPFKGAPIVRSFPLSFE